MDSVIFLSWTIALSCESSSDTGFSLPDTIHTFIHRKVLIKIMNIAICDDEILFTRELSSLLTHWAEKNDFSLTLYPYSNGDDLLTALRTIPVDLIFLDIIMPLLNGIDTAREIRSMGLTVPVIFLTSSREFALDSYDVKAFHYLLKPVNTLKLFSVMDDFLEMDVIVFPLYPEDFAEAGKYLSKCLEKFYEIHPDRKLTMISITNKNYLIPEITEDFRKYLSDSAMV